MRRSKLRGARRKLRNLEKHLMNATNDFPSSFYEGIYSYKLPTSQQFIDALDSKGKTRITHYLIERAMFLKMIKPEAAHKIVILLFPQNFWHSQIVIFENADILKYFFDRQNPWQVWREVKKASRQPIISIDWDIKMYEEIIKEDDWIEQQKFICLMER